MVFKQLSGVVDDETWSTASMDRDGEEEVVVSLLKSVVC